MNEAKNERGDPGAYWLFNDGGRKDAGRKGDAGDCVTRAIAIATGKPYREVYDEINALAGKAVARTGVRKKVYAGYLASLGWRWVPVMKIGSGCTMHLRPGEIPEGRIIARCSRHIVAVINGIVHDTYDSTRGGTRCVYGFWVGPGVSIPASFSS